MGIIWRHYTHNMGTIWAHQSEPNRLKNHAATRRWRIPSPDTKSSRKAQLGGDILTSQYAPRDSRPEGPSRRCIPCSAGCDGRAMSERVGKPSSNTHHLYQNPTMPNVAIPPLKAGHPYEQRRHPGPNFPFLWWGFRGFYARPASVYATP